jgi:hypothetical protein
MRTPRLAGFAMSATLNPSFGMCDVLVQFPTVAGHPADDPCTFRHFRGTAATLFGERMGKLQELRAF